MEDTKAQKEAFKDTWSNVTYIDTIEEIHDLDLDLYNFLKALDNINQITISEKLDGDSVVWSNSGTPDEWKTGGVWGDATTVKRPLFLVNVTFPNRGSQLDITTWDYWQQSENYTKIQDMVNLYKPPGSTFELRLTAPTEWSRTIEIFSNTLIA